MDNTQSTNRTIVVAAWSALLVWWGVSLLVDPITIGISAAGTGLILLTANGARALNHIPAVPGTTVAGLTALLWGTLDQVLALPLGPSVATLLIVCGVMIFGTSLARRSRPGAAES